MNILKFISTLSKCFQLKADNHEISEDLKKANWEIKYNDLGIFNYNNLGFDIELKDGFHSIKWTDIERIQAYKVDLLTTDEVCIEITNDNKILMISEETKGWYQFIDKLKSKLSPTCDNWEALVLEKPFEYNLTTIYERADRKMPSKSNFFSVIKGVNKENIKYIFQKHGWTIQQSSKNNIKIQNSWTELYLDCDEGDILLHGLIAYHKNNIEQIKYIFKALECSYQYEFYDNEIIVDHAHNGM